MDNQGSKCSAQAVALAFIGGAVAGVVAGLLLAPQSGEETRRALRGMQEGRGRSSGEGEGSPSALDESIERGKHFLAEKKADVEAAFKAGREAMKEKVDKCCS